MALDVTVSEYEKTIKEAEDALADLGAQLNNVTINIGPSSVDVLTAIKYIFGPEYVTNNRSAITYDMYKTVIKNLKLSGKLKVGEYL